MKIHAHGINVRQCSPGDSITIVGVYMAAALTGFQAMRAGLAQDTYIEAYQICKDKLNFRDYLLSDTMMKKVYDVKNSSENDH
jgi:DNA replication licensing factor MCM7